MVLAGLFFAGDLAVWHFSILFTSVANSTLLANLAPIFVTVGAWLLFRQRVSGTFLAGMAIAMAGAFVLVGPSFGLGGRQLLGDGLGVVTAMFYGAYMLAVKHLREARSTAHVMAVSTSVCAAVLLPLAIASGEIMLPATGAGWLTLFGLALVCQTAGQSLIAYAMAHLPASFSAVSLLLQPAMATLYAWAILGEGAGLAQLAGGAVILFGIWLARKGS
jgi:drug/metabolite transporter (DMT)-like permease